MFLWETADIISISSIEIKADAECFETVYARENPDTYPEGFDPDIHEIDPEQLQDKPDPEPTGCILFLL
ncbi:hypothetical protein [Streptosporangium sp. CA-115845]|uniref:hypothetical protein n=1 Tax=Streptosporangium sp. CA-115845 TaxID=3240071 RepID=UPI003D8FC2DF